MKPHRLTLVPPPRTVAAPPAEIQPPLRVTPLPTQYPVDTYLRHSRRQTLKQILQGGKA